MRDGPCHETGALSSSPREGASLRSTWWPRTVERRKRHDAVRMAESHCWKFGPTSRRSLLLTAHVCAASSKSKSMTKFEGE